MILVLNAGSSSIKYALLAPFGNEPGTTAGPAPRGIVERIGVPGSGVPDHRTALSQVLERLALGSRTVRAVGHRVVHGGARFSRPTLIDDEVLGTIRDLVPLAPLHNPPAIQGIEAARQLLPDVKQVAVFDTAFHASLPAVAATYAMDAELAARHGIRRYGFHGISVAYVARRTAALLGRELSELNLIVLHLGNGASATAVQNGRSVETSMGFTPLEGLVMGTRSGDLDPAIVTFLQRTAGLSFDEVSDLLHHRSGLLGLAGAADMREVLEARESSEAAALAFDVYCHRIRKYVGAYHAVLGPLDAITFTAGVGEHAALVRAQSLSGLEPWGIAVDPARNNAPGGSPRVISPEPRATRVVRRGAGAASPGVAVCVVPTDEETAIAEDVASVLAGGARPEGPGRD